MPPPQGFSQASFSSNRTVRTPAAASCAAAMAPAGPPPSTATSLTVCAPLRRRADDRGKTALFLLWSRLRRHHAVAHARVHFLLHDPLVALALERVAHGHAAHGSAAFRPEADHGVGLVVPEGDAGDLDVHRSEVEAGVLREMLDDSLAHGFVGLDVFRAAGQEGQGEGERERGCLHNCDYTGPSRCDRLAACGCYADGLPLLRWLPLPRRPRSRTRSSGAGTSTSRRRPASAPAGWAFMTAAAGWRSGISRPRQCVPAERREAGRRPACPDDSGHRPDAPRRGVELEARGDRLAGQIRRGETATPIEGKRAPELKRPEPKAWTEPRPLFNGRDLTGWEPAGNPANSHWKAVNGELVNEKLGANLKTTEKFEDFRLHFEVMPRAHPRTAASICGAATRSSWRTSRRHKPARAADGLDLRAHRAEALRLPTVRGSGTCST